jgi:hypothetical protein
MRPEEITLAIFEKYKPEELAEVAQQMAQAVADMETAEMEKKVSDGVFNERIKKCSAQVSELASKYNKGGETAQIGCKIRYDIPAPGKKSYIRFDTEEVVEVHDMTEGEKQETFQFPLAAAEEKKADEPPADAPAAAPADEPAPQPPQPQGLTFKDVQAVGNNIAKLESAQHRAQAVTEWKQKLGERFLAQGSIIGPDGTVHAIEAQPMAEALAEAWLTISIEKALNPPPTDELTRICPYPGCILFADHEGGHEFPPAAEGPKGTESAEAQPQPQPEKKPKRKRGFAPPPDEQPPAPGVRP